MKKFTSSIDKTSVIITWLVVAVSFYIFISGALLFRNPNITQAHAFFKTLLSVVLFMLIGLLYLLHTTALSVDSTSITIERKLMPVRISYSDIVSIKLLQKEDMGIAIRTMGNGGIFGYTGMFYSKNQGFMRWYCTNRNSYIIIEKTNGKKIVISPDEPENIINELRSVAPSVKIVNA
jgi:hypothetical protein